MSSDFKFFEVSSLLDSSFSFSTFSCSFCTIRTASEDSSSFFSPVNSSFVSIFSWFSLISSFSVILISFSSSCSSSPTVVTGSAIFIEDGSDVIIEAINEVACTLDILRVCSFCCFSFFSSSCLFSLTLLSTTLLRLDRRKESVCETDSSERIFFISSSFSCNSFCISSSALSSSSLDLSLTSGAVDSGSFSLMSASLLFRTILALSSKDIE
mmetsp:Transcript_5998/g.6602  ORF Transcript_5998/g.6602 Transcript_5998/m.6602 type:complete len:212 (+) Transcript_5998:1131-1766(+)